MKRIGARINSFYFIILIFFNCLGCNSVNNISPTVEETTSPTPSPFPTLEISNTPVENVLEIKEVNSAYINTYSILQIPYMYILTQINAKDMSTLSPDEPYASIWRLSLQDNSYQLVTSWSSVSEETLGQVLSRLSLEEISQGTGISIDELMDYKEEFIDLCG